MAEEIQFLNSIEAAKVLGVNVSSIKRWTDAGKLECIQTAGGHRKFLMTHLVKFIQDNDTSTSKAHIFPIENEEDLEISFHVLKGDFDFLTNYMLRKARNSERSAVLKVLSGLYLGQYALHQVYDKLVTPVLQQIGTLWMNDEISVLEEHIAAQTMREAISRLQGIIKIPEQKIGKALFINLSSELHDIALKMTENILEVRGFSTFYSGQMTPFIKMEDIFDKIRPDRLYVSSTYVFNRDATQEEVRELFTICRKFNTKVYVGGRGWDVLDYDHEVVVKRMYDFEETYLS
jgi:excisionase family DNA binding protein